MKKVEPEAAVIPLARARKKIRQKLTEIDVELTAAVRAAHKAGVKPTRLSELTGLSRPTIYDRLR